MPGPDPPGRPHATLHSWLRLWGLRSSIADTRSQHARLLRPAIGRLPKTELAPARQCWRDRIAR